MALTDIACRNAQPQSKSYMLSDTGNLYLYIMPNGGRYWRFRYRIHGKQKALNLGAYPKVSLIKAREKRDYALAVLDKGVDPLIDKHQQKQLAKYKAEQTFETVAREWHEKNYSTWSKRHAQNIIYRLELDVFGQIGRYPIDCLTAPMVFSCIEKIQARGANEMARRSLQMIGQVLRYAVVTGRAERDFTRDFKGTLKKYKRGHYAAIDIEELPELVKAINRNEARLYKQSILAMKLMLLTFVRTSELMESQWKEFDLEKAEWVIPAERMKMRIQHVVPLSKQAIEILNELKKMQNYFAHEEAFEKRPYVFPSIPRPWKPMCSITILAGLKRLGYKGKMTGHGFRALAMSAIKEKLGYRHEVVDRQLAHIPVNKVDKAYDRAKFLDERKIMMQQWADYIDSLV